MNNQNLNPIEIIENIETKLSRYFGCTAQEASADQMYKAVSMTIRDILTEKRGDFKKEVNKEGAKRVYYMCMELLLGRSLKTNVCNLGMDKAYAEALKELGFDLSELYEIRRPFYEAVSDFSHNVSPLPEDNVKSILEVIGL